jgi:transposase
MHSINLLCNGVLQVIQKKIPGELSENIILLHDNIQPHMEDLMVILATVGWAIMNHPPYSPDIATSEGACRKTKISNL